MSTEKVWISPVDGEPYGFPKITTMEIYSDKERFKSWLVQNGYPNSKLNWMGFTLVTKVEETK